MMMMMMSRRKGRTLLWRSQWQRLVDCTVSFRLWWWSWSGGLFPSPSFHGPRGLIFDLLSDFLGSHASGSRTDPGRRGVGNLFCLFCFPILGNATRYLQFLTQGFAQNGGFPKNTVFIKNTIFMGQKLYVLEDFEVASTRLCQSQAWKCAVKIEKCRWLERTGRELCDWDHHSWLGMSLPVNFKFQRNFTLGQSGRLTSKVCFFAIYCGPAWRAMVELSNGWLTFVGGSNWCSLSLNPGFLMASCRIIPTYTNWIYSSIQ